VVQVLADARAAESSRPGKAAIPKPAPALEVKAQRRAPSEQPNPAPTLDETASPGAAIAPDEATEVRVATESLEAREPRDFLMAELSLINGASHALRAGQPTDALQQLRRHRELYGDGLLKAERQGLTALALCDLGRAASARAQAERFLRGHPESPLAARVRRALVCAGAPR
jgi:hypothetical protein